MNDRIERLKSDAAELNVSKGAARDGLWQTVGALAMAAGVVDRLFDVSDLGGCPARC